MLFRAFGWSIGITILGLIAGFVYGGPSALAIVAILIVLEVSLSFDNAVVNATVLERMSPFWQKIFLTIGIAIAVFGMRLVFPLVIVSVTAQLNPIEAIQLAMEKGDPTVPGTYGYLIHDAHPAIAAFGGMFLFMLFLDFIFEHREITWLSWIERPLGRIGKLDRLAIIVSLTLLCITAFTFAPEGKTSTVMLSGVLGLITYAVVNGLGELFNIDDTVGDDGAVEGKDGKSGAGAVTLAVGKAGFFLFVYLEVLDASFSFDGVVGAFAITSDPIIIAIGLGVGTMFIRSVTVYLVHKGALKDYAYLEHGAMWAVGALAVLMLLTIKFEVSEVIIGLVGVTLIVAAFLTSVVRNRRDGGDDADLAEQPDEAIAK
ncbi:DUF475 domain-containing protein [Tomitella biformata]|uniref:DUF475 domain-containing protein n=1 Tax=Tomitella biformata TaxID=630403 RepID=UPI000467D682|nr:DUF475 domain-containing protein [Tomitella biformata]